jgi:hypothetical protein
MVPLPALPASGSRRGQPRHPIHGDLLTDDEWEHWRRTARPLQVGPVLHVDTTQPVNTQVIIDWIHTPH